MFSFIPLSDHPTCSVSQDWSSEERQSTVVSPTVQTAREIVFGDEYSLPILFLQNKHLHVLHINTRKKHIGKMMGGAFGQLSCSLP